MHIPNGVHDVYGQRSYGGPGARVDKPARALLSPGPGGTRRRPHPPGRTGVTRPVWPSLSARPARHRSLGQTALVRPPGLAVLIRPAGPASLAWPDRSCSPGQTVLIRPAGPVSLAPPYRRAFLGE